MIRDIAAAIAEGRTPAYSDPKEDQRHRNKMAMRRKRFREDPERVLNYRAWKYGVQNQLKLPPLQARPPVHSETTSETSESSLSELTNSPPPEHCNNQHEEDQLYATMFGPWQERPAHVPTVHRQ